MKRPSKSIRKNIRKEKSRIRKEVLNVENQIKLIKELRKKYENKRNI